MRRLFLLAALGWTMVCHSSSYAQDNGTLSSKSMAYVLQADLLRPSRALAVQNLKNCGRDLIVLDSAYNGDDEGDWTSQEISTIRSGKSGRRVLAYLSIGEAEVYRKYWNPTWDANNDGQPDAGAPSFLLKENPDWAGNYKVKYWDQQWQNIILSQVDFILAQGFDGLYLDIVDGFEFFEELNGAWIDNRINSETGNTYRQDMISWVARIADHARQKQNCLILPQNGSQLLENTAYAELIDAIGVEDLFTSDNQLQPRQDTNYILGFLQKIILLKKPVFVVEYPTKPRVRRYALQNARKRHLSLLITNRDLTTIGYFFPPR